MNPSTAKLITVIGAGSSERQLEAALVSWLPALRSRAKHWAKWAGDLEGQYLEDVVQHVSLTVFVELRKKAEGSAHQSIERTEPYWVATVDHMAADFYRSTGASWFAEKSLYRRLAKIPAAVEKLQQATGALPSAEAVAEHINSEARRRMADAQKAGALISAAEIKASGLLEHLGALR